MEVGPAGRKIEQLKELARMEETAASDPDVPQPPP